MRSHLVYGQPALYTATREGLAWAGMPQLDPARVGVATTRHWALCARLAVELEPAERLRGVGGAAIDGQARSLDHRLVAQGLVLAWTPSVLTVRPLGLTDPADPS